MGIFLHDPLPCNSIGRYLKKIPYMDIGYVPFNMSESCPHQAVLKAVHPVHKEMGLGMHCNIHVNENGGRNLLMDTHTLLKILKNCKNLKLS